MSGLSVAEAGEGGTRNRQVLSAGLTRHSALRAQHFELEVKDGTCGDHRCIDRRFAGRL